MNIATINDFDKVWSIFQDNKEWFPHVWNTKINKRIEAYSNEKKLIVVVDLNRPAILKSIKESSSGLIGTFGVQDRIIFEGLFGEFNPSGKLPFEIPSSMESVLNQKEDLPDDSANPTYEFGYGISY